MKDAAEYDDYGDEKHEAPNAGSALSLLYAGDPSSPLSFHLLSIHKSSLRTYRHTLGDFHAVAVDIAFQDIAVV